MYIMLFALIMGIMTGRYPSFLWMMLLFLIGYLILSNPSKISNKDKCLAIALGLSAFFFGLTSFSYFNTNKLDSHYQSLMSYRVQVIEVDHAEDSSRTRLIVKGLIEGENLNYHGRMLLHTHYNNDIKPGMMIEGSGILAQPKSATNFLTFDYKDYLKRKGIYGVIYVDEIQVISEKLPYRYRITNGFINYIHFFCDEFFLEKPSGILKSLLTGRTAHMDKDLLEGVRHLGMAHVLAISGMHMGIIIAAIEGLAILMRVPQPYRRVISLFIGWLYGFLIGFPTSTVRALMMLSWLSLGQMTHRRIDKYRIFGLTVLLMLAYKPMWLFDVGFQLSVFAVLSILTVHYLPGYNKGSKRKKTIMIILWIQWMTIPISLYYFNVLPLLGAVMNLLLVPIISIGMVFSMIGLGLFILTPILARWVMFPTVKLMGILTYILESLGNKPWVKIKVGSPPIYQIIFFYVVTLFIVFLIQKDDDIKLRDIEARLISVFVGGLILYNVIYLLIPVYWVYPLQIAIIDVGQGQSVIVQYKRAHFMIDAGGQVGKDYFQTDYVFPEYFIKRGIKKLDAIFISHLHLDHYSGIDKINKHLKVGSFIGGHFSAEDLDLEQETTYYSIMQEDIILLDNQLQLTVKWPNKEVISNDENQNSLVIELKYEDFSMLFTGDVGIETEAQLLRSLNPVNIVMVPHHGSKTSSSLEFIQQINPEYGIMSYGKNHYGIPSDEVIKRYELCGVLLLSTFDDGEIQVKVDKTGHFQVNTKNQDKEKITMSLMGWSICFLSLIIIKKTCLKEDTIAIKIGDGSSWT